MAKNNTNDRVDQIDRFHKTRKGRLSFGFIELAVAYVFVSLAIDSGSVWEYLAAIVLAVGAVNNLIRAFTGGVGSNGKKSTKKH